MKLYITSKKIRENYIKSHTFNVSDCENAVKHFFNPCGYNCGVYGWNFDFFQFSNLYEGKFYNFCFVAGYRSFPASVRLPENIRLFIENAYKNSMEKYHFQYEKRVIYDKKIRKMFLEKIHAYLKAEDEKERAKRKAKEERENLKTA